jgi:hypothetical protein
MGVAPAPSRENCPGGRGKTRLLRGDQREAERIAYHATARSATVSVTCAFSSIQEPSSPDPAEREAARDRQSVPHDTTALGDARGDDRTPGESRLQQDAWKAFTTLDWKSQPIGTPSGVGTSALDSRRIISCSILIADIVSARPLPKGSGS